MTDISEATWSYRPGSWYAVFGPEVTVLLPPEQRDHVIGLWALVEGGAGFEEVLDGLLATGLSTLPGFVLVATSGTTIRVLVRGAGVTATIRAAEEVVLEGHEAGTWVERTVAGAVAVAVTVPESAGDEDHGTTDYAIPAGLVSVGRIDLPAVTGPTGHGATDEVAEETPYGWLTPWGTAPPAAEPAEVVDEVAAEAAVAAVGEDSDHDGHTVGRAGLAESFDNGPIDQAPVAPVAQLHTSDGQTVVVDRAVLIGRAPQARRFSATGQPTLVTVPSRLHEISSTHVEVRPGAGADHGSAVVTDLGSTNGTVLEQPGLAAEDLKPGVAVALLPGARINLGDGITIQVTRP